MAKAAHSVSTASARGSARPRATGRDGARVGCARRAARRAGDILTGLAVAVMVVGFCGTGSAALGDDGVTLLITADTEGHVTPCGTCPAGRGLGGLSRRAARLADLRGQGAAVLLLDTGNALGVPDGLDRSGRVIVAAYDGLGYDALNISYRDF